MCSCLSLSWPRSRADNAMTSHPLLTNPWRSNYNFVGWSQLRAMTSQASRHTRRASKERCNRTSKQAHEQSSYDATAVEYERSASSIGVLDNRSPRWGIGMPGVATGHLGGFKNPVSMHVSPVQHSMEVCLVWFSCGIEIHKLRPCATP